MVTELHALEVVMSVQTEHRFQSDLSVLDAAGGRVTLADLRGRARAVALYFMRTGTCPPCIYHARALARLDLSSQGVQPIVVVPGSSAHAVRVRRIVGDRVTVVSTPSAEAHMAAGLHRTLFLQHSGVVLIDAAGAVRYRRATALPTGSFDGAELQTAIDRM
jgi:peroxiredoxin